MEVSVCFRCSKPVPVHKTLRSASPEADGRRVCTQCSRRPSVDAVMGMGAPTTCAAPSADSWVKAIGLVEFDLALGIVVRYLNPPLPLAVQQETEIAFLCFPDANLVSDGDSVHDFVYAYNPSEFDHSRTGIKREHSSGEDSHSGSPASPSSSSGDRAGYQEGFGQFFCTAVFRQQRDPTVTRGARQNAILIMSAYPFPQIHRQMLKELVSYFDSPDVDPTAFLQNVHSNIISWPPPMPDTVYEGLPLLGTTLSFTTPHYTPTSSSWSVAQPTVELTVHQRSDRRRVIDLVLSNEASGSALDSAIVSVLRSATGSSPISGILETDFGWNDETKALSEPLSQAQLLELLNLMREEDLEWMREVTQTTRDNNSSTAGASPSPQKQNEGVSPSAGSAGSPSPPSSPSSPRDVSSSSSSILKGLLHHFRHGGSPAEAFLTQQNEQLELLQQRFDYLMKYVTPQLTKGGAGGGVAGSCRPAQPHETVTVFSEVELNKALYPHITKLWKMWELVITGQPVAIIGPNAPVVSSIALGLASLVAPLEFVGLLRPYLTINNREIDHCVKTVPQPSSIVAATNPFFVRHWLKWPHFLCIGDADGDVQTHKTLPTDSEKRGKQQFKLKNRMFCSRHYLVKTDKTHNDLLLKAPSGKGIYMVGGAASGGSSGAGANASTPSAEIRSIFQSLTVDFLAPVKRYVDTVLAMERPYFVSESTLRGLFNPKTILEAVQCYQPSSFSRFKTVNEALSVYETFLTCPVFYCWLQVQVQAGYRQTLMDADGLEDLLMLQPDPSKRHEVLFRLQWDFERALRQPVVEVELLSKLSSLCRLLPSLRLRLAAVDAAASAE